MTDALYALHQTASVVTPPRGWDVVDTSTPDPERYVCCRVCYDREANGSDERCQPCRSLVGGEDLHSIRPPQIGQGRGAGHWHVTRRRHMHDTLSLAAGVAQTFADAVYGSREIAQDAASLAEAGYDQRGYYRTNAGDRTRLVLRRRSDLGWREITVTYCTMRHKETPRG